MLQTIHRGLGLRLILWYNLSNGKRDIKFSTWNVRRLYRSVPLMQVASELARYKLGLVVVQQVRWEKGGSIRVGDYTFL